MAAFYQNALLLQYFQMTQKNYFTNKKYKYYVQVVLIGRVYAAKKKCSLHTCLSHHQTPAVSPPTMCKHIILCLYNITHRTCLCHWYPPGFKQYNFYGNIELEQPFLQTERCQISNIANSKLIKNCKYFHQQHLEKTHFSSFLIINFHQVNDG